MKDARRGTRKGAGTGLGLLFALTFSAVAAEAQTRKIHEYKLHEQEDRGAPFGMAVGPDHTVYTILPRRDGNWILSEVQGWWQEKPHEIGIVVEGIAARDEVSAPGQMDLAVTPDGRFLVTILTAGLRVGANDPYPMEMIVEVVRLDNFTVVQTQHMRGLGLRGNLAGGLDGAGHLLVSSSLPGGGDDATSAPYVSWLEVSLPEMKPQLECSYQAGADAKDPQPMEEACADFAKKDGYASAAELIAQVWPQTKAAEAPPGVAIAAKDRFDARTVTVDGKALTVVVINGVEVQVYAPQ
ncbi:MAG TPA: hypothetical protein VIY53_09925 [Acidobacteriaceae bacterium]